MTSPTQQKQLILYLSAILSRGSNCITQSSRFGDSSDMTCRSADPEGQRVYLFGIRVVGFGIVGMEDQPMVWRGGMYSAYCVVGEML